MGWSTRIDNLLAPYVEKSYINYIEEIKEDIKLCSNSTEINMKNVKKRALDRARTDLEQGLQGLEYKLNSVASSRGDYPFTTFAFGEGESEFEQMVSIAALKVRKCGQGKKGKKKQVLFPKLVFLYDENLHGKGKKLEYMFDEAIECSSVSMYPDYLSLTGEGYVAEIYKKYNEVVYPMGWRDSSYKTPLIAGNLSLLDKAISSQA